MLAASRLQILGFNNLTRQKVTTKRGIKLTLSKCHIIRKQNGVNRSLRLRRFTTNNGKFLSFNYPQCI